MGEGLGEGGLEIHPDRRGADDGKRPRALALPLGVCQVSLRTPEGFFLCFFLSLSGGERRMVGSGAQNHRKPKKNYPKNCASFAIAFPMFSRRKSLPEWIQKWSRTNQKGMPETGPQKDHQKVRFSLPPATAGPRKTIENQGKT